MEGELKQSNESDKPPVLCSFCGKAHTQVLRLIQGPGCYICNECVAVCSDVLAKECGKDLKRFGERWMALYRASVEDELRWLKEQHTKGLLSETVYLERQRELIRPTRAEESARKENLENLRAGPVPGPET